MSELRCPLCSESTNQHKHGDFDGYEIECKYCGKWELTNRAALEIERYTSAEKSQIAHTTRWADEQRLRLSVTSVRALAARSLPGPVEQAERLLEWLFTRHPIGEALELNEKTARPILGFGSPAAGRLALQYASEESWLKLDERAEIVDFGWCYDVTITATGYVIAEQLESRASSGKLAFMAMKFGDSELDSFYLQKIKPAVKDVGFNLQRVDEEARTGLIDNNMMLKIRQSSFVIVDLTHENLGAYWEAGYAEGLGKKVIYLCEASKFEESQTHFDTNHRQTIVWKSDEPLDCLTRLQDMIMLEFPEAVKSRRESSQV